MKPSALKHFSKSSIFKITPVILLGFLASCTPKPAVVEGTQTNMAERIAQGKVIYDNSCGKCHDLPNPTDHSAQDWVGIMNWMAPKANLNEEQKDMAYDYVVSVKKEEKEAQ